MTGVLSCISQILVISANLMKEYQQCFLTFLWRPDSFRIVFFFNAMNSIFNYGINFDDIVQINRIYKIEDQRCVSNCNYGYFIKIDGKEIHSVVNSNTIQFCNVKIYPFKNYFYYYLFRLAPVTIGAKKK